MSETQGAPAGGGEPSGFVSHQASAPGSTQPTITPAEYGGDPRAALAALRGQMLDPQTGMTRAEVKQRFDDVSRHLYAGGPRPSWLDAKAAPTEAELNAPAFDPQTGFPREDAVRMYYEPAQAPDDYHFANLPQTASREAVGEIKAAMHSLGLSRVDGAKMFEEFTRLQGLVPTAEHQTALDDILAQSWGDRYDENVALAQKAWGRMPAALRQDIEQNFPAFMLSPWVFGILARAQRAHEMRGGK